MPNTENDRVRVYPAEDGWRWQRIDNANGKIVAESGEAYDDKTYTEEQAAAYNPGVEVVVDDTQGGDAV